MAAHMYFAGASTLGGFKSFFTDLLPRGEEGKICCLHGGPGTGKSTLLRALASQWEAAGREVIYYPCASDPDSLDAIAGGPYAALDATPPHTLTSDLPGMRDQVIDLNRCLDARVLAAQWEEGMALSQRMRQQYQRAFRCLGAAQTAQDDCAAIYAAATDQGALCNLRLELMQWMTGAPGTSQRVFAQAVTAKGTVSLAENLLRPQTLCLDLPFGCDPDPIIYPLAVMLHARGTGAISAMQPLNGQRMAHLCTSSHAIVCLSEPGCETRTLKFDESVLRASRETLAFNRAAYDLWLHQAVEALAQAKECHDSLERLYADAVNERLRRELSEEALSMFR